jgi:hypothetical protein
VSFFRARNAQSQTKFSSSPPSIEHWRTQQLPSTHHSKFIQQQQRPVSTMRLGTWLFLVFCTHTTTANLVAPAAGLINPRDVQTPVTKRWEHKHLHNHDERAPEPTDPPPVPRLIANRQHGDRICGWFGNEVCMRFHLIQPDARFSGHESSSPYYPLTCSINTMQLHRSSVPAREPSAIQTPSTTWLTANIRHSPASCRRCASTRPLATRGSATAFVLVRCAGKNPDIITTVLMN